MIQNKDRRKKDVLYVPNVPSVIERSSSKGFKGTQNTIATKTQHVPHVLPGTLRTRPQKQVINHGVPKEPKKTSAYSPSGTQEHIEHITNTLNVSDRETFEERAAIMEFDGGMMQEEAERSALNDLFTIEDYTND